MRFTDNDMAKVGLMDFTPRTRSRNTIYLVAAYVCTIIAVFVAMTQDGSDASRSVGATLVSIIIIALGLVSLYFRQRNNDQLLATEFQNMLYSSAAETGTLFCIIVKRNGTSVHASRNLNSLFNYFPYPTTQALDGFFIESRLPKFDQAKISEALEQSEPKSFLIKASTSSGLMDMVITVDPLTRPPGYCVIRGRTFSDKRGDPEKLASIPAQQFQLILDSSPIGHFVCDEHGSIRYANPSFASMCGSHPDAMVENRTIISKIFSMQAGESFAKDYEFKPIDNQPVYIQGPNAVKVMLTLQIHRHGKDTSLLGTVAAL